MSDFETFTFLQLANVLIDSNVIDALEITGQLRAKRRQEALENFLKAIAEAKKRGVDAVLIVGNLWQTETVTENSICAVLEALASLDDIPVFITPAVYDHNSIDSPFNEHFLKARGLKQFSANVHIFSQNEFGTIRHPRLEDITFTGHSYQNSNFTTLTTLRNELTRIGDSKLKLVLLPDHLDKLGDDQEQTWSKTNPFMDMAKPSPAEILNLPANYTASGSGNHYAELIDEHGTIVGAQSGSLTGQTRFELGKRYGVLGQLIKQTNGKFACSLEPIEFDNRRICSLNFDVSALNLPEAGSEILNLLEEEGARKGIDIVVIEVEGNYHHGQDPALLRQTINDNFFHAVIVDKMRPNYLSEAFPANSPEDRFVKALFARETNTGDLVEDALYYGLDALRQKQVTLRDFN